MAGWISEDKKRNVIPRWRDFNQTLNLGELSPLPVSKGVISNLITSDFHQKKVTDWETERSVKNAIELLNSSFVLDDKDMSLQSATYLNANSAATSKPLLKLTEKIVAPNRDVLSFEQLSDFEHLEAMIGSMIKNLRVCINHNMNNSISWIELARLYLIVGKELAAERCILVGVQLAPHNRYVSRTAARFFAHIGDYKKAKKILKTNMAFNADPWLVSADIGISSLQNKSSNNIKKARELAGSNNYSSYELNELFAALATEELTAGSIKNSRRLFNQSLITPNDNTLAQAVWANRHISDLNLYQNSFDKVPNVYEAKAYQHYNAKQWGQTMSNTLKWFIDQPFSRDPASFGSFIACSVLERFDEAIKLCRYGLKATPNDFTLTNNLAFSLLKINDVSGAHSVFQKIHADSLDDQQRIVYLATRGLLMYKLGLPQYGAQLYNESGGLASKTKNKKLQLLSEFHHLSIQLESEGFPDSKFSKIEKLSSELESLNEVYLKDIVTNLMKRVKEYREKH